MTIALIAVVLSAATSGLVYNRTAARHRNVSELVARALSHDAGTDYIAHVVTRAHYNGKRIQTSATLYHQGSMEKLEYSGSPGRRVWSMLKDGKSYTYLPKENKILVSETSQVLSDAQRSRLLTENYRMVSDGLDQVAGRDAYVVDISSRYGGRPSKKLWIDKRRLTVLRSVDYSAAGDERGSMEIERIHYDARMNPVTFALPSSVKMVMVCKSAKSMDLFRALGFPIRAPGYLPTGYKVEGYHLFNSRCICDHRSAQITYTDGLNVISVFQTPRMASCCKTIGGAKCDDRNCGIATQGQVTRDGRTIVVVGDLLPQDVTKIAESVR